MSHNAYSWKGAGITCCLTALLNALPAAYAQENLPTATYSQELLATPVFPPALPAGENVLRYGPWDVLPRMRGYVTYDNNIFIQADDEQDDVIWTFAPGMLIGTGDYRVQESSAVFLDYTPSFNVFTRNSHQNSIDHDLRLKAGWRPGRYAVTLQQLYQNFSGPVLDVGNRVNRSLYITGIAFTYELSPKTSMEINGSQAVTDYDDVSSYNEWNVAGFFDYALTPKIKIGAGINAGWADIQNAGNQTYQQGLVRVVYAASEKVDIRGSAGAEVRQFQSDEDDKLNGVFSVGGTYKPLEFTQILVDAYRRDQNSVVLAGQNYTTTGFSVGVRQEFLVKYAATISGGYDHLHYHNASPTVNASRRDDYYFLRAALDWRIMDRLSAGLSYLYRKNDSNSIYSFENHQVGLNVAYQF